MKHRMKARFRPVILLSIMFISIILLSTPPLSQKVITVNNPVSITINTDATADSPPFANHEIIDDVLVWIDLNTQKITEGGDRSTDMESVDYYSDGDTLNAILWLFFYSHSELDPINEEVDYGMFIDADFDNTTGFGGIDYKVELNWDNQSKSWTKVLEKWSHFGDTIVLDNKTVPYSDFSKEGAHYVLLSTDLDAMLSPIITLKQYVQ